MNSYERQWSKIEGGEFDWRSSMRRPEFAERYSWAIPNELAIDAIAALEMDVVEIGAGTGYWAKLMSERGITVHAYDVRPPLKRRANRFSHKHQWHPVHIGTERKVRKHTNCALFLCWPYMDDTAINCVRQYKGDTVIYVGEPGQGCTANDAFFEEMWDNWEEAVEVYIPQWSGMRDVLTIYKRGL